MSCSLVGHSFVLTLDIKPLSCCGELTNDVRLTVGGGERSGKEHLLYL